jgi:hypothetical protein
LRFFGFLFEALGALFVEHSAEFRSRIGVAIGGEDMAVFCQFGKDAP